MDNLSIFQSEREEGTAGGERRRSPRYGCEGLAEAYAADPGYLFRGEIRDISQTGCYIRTNARLRLERFTELDIIFMLRSRSHRAAARVVAVRPGQGVGMEFLSCAPRPDESFEELIRAVVPVRPVRPPSQLRPVAARRTPGRGVYVGVLSSR